MSTLPGKGPEWWDRGTDSSGRDIRADVRAAAQEVWDTACKRAKARLGDAWYASELMEYSVERLSLYLDAKNVAPFSPNVARRLLLFFTKELNRLARRSRRLEFVGNSELDRIPELVSWERDLQYRLDRERIVQRYLSERAATIVYLKGLGKNWKYIAEALGVPVASVRTAFWREVHKLPL